MCICVFGQDNEYAYSLNEYAYSFVSNNEYANSLTLNLILPQAPGYLTLTLRLSSANRLQFNGW